METRVEAPWSVDEPPPGQVAFRAGRPPNFAAIAKVFPAAHNLGTIFTYGNVIYVANGAGLPRSLIAHEVIHVKQQELYGRDEWWDRYLTDKQWRFEQELAAHRMELATTLQEGGRQHRRVATQAIAKRLSGPLYGHVVTFAKAKQLLSIAALDRGLGGAA